MNLDQEYHLFFNLKSFVKVFFRQYPKKYERKYDNNKRCKSLWKNVELHSMVISIDTKMFFFLLERA